MSKRKRKVRRWRQREDYIPPSERIEPGTWEFSPEKPDDSPATWELLLTLLGVRYLSATRPHMNSGEFARDVRKGWENAAAHMKPFRHPIEPSGLKRYGKNRVINGLSQRVTLDLYRLSIARENRRKRKAAKKAKKSFKLQATEDLTIDLSGTVQPEPDMFYRQFLEDSRKRGN